MLKVVIDTNIWLSALIASGTPKRLIENWLSYGRFSVVYSSWLIDELKQVRKKPRLAKRIFQNDLENLIQLIEEEGFLVNPTVVAIVSRDPKDDPFLACAKEANSDYLITGDYDLLCLKTHGQTRIVSASEFLEIIEGPDFDA